MTIYKTIGKKLATLCAITTALAATGCTQDEALPGNHTGTLIPDATSGIFISGAGAGGTNTRSFVEPADETTGPQVEGISRADKMDVFVFQYGSDYTTNWPTAEKLTWTKTLSPEVKIIGNDRYAKCNAEINHIDAGYSFSNYTYVLSSALAYTDADKELFNVTLTGDGVNRTNIPLELQKDNGVYKTPELFYGIVRGKGDIINDEDFTDGFYWTGKNNKVITFYGRIFRIVSQLNLCITDIPSEAIEKIELYGDNYPTKIILYGTHGTYYPVTAADLTTGEAPAGDNTDLAQSANYVLLDSKDITDGTEEITLSTFLLPSEKGMHLKLRVHFRNVSNQGDADNNIASTYKDYDLRPDKSYTLSGADANVYSVGTNLRTSTGELYVFDNSQGKLCFYSYANVRVNMSGKYENIAGETSTANITIEVDPRFEHGPYINGSFQEEHDIEL